jgi:hypothetical protein
MSKSTLGTLKICGEVIYPRVIHNKYGWFVEFPNGFTSVMPNEETARLLAGAPKLEEALKTCLCEMTCGKEHREFGKALDDTNPRDFHEAVLDKARTVLAEVKGVSHEA